MSEVVRPQVTAEALGEVSQLQFALADLLRALLTQDENYIIADLGKVHWHRNKLIGALMEWWPELRIAGDED